MTFRTNRALRLTITRSTVLDVPAGAALEAVAEDDMGRPCYAVVNPEQYLPRYNNGPTSSGRHDLTYHYAYVPLDAVEVVP